MGQAKRLLEEQRRQGFEATEKFVCDRCFDDYALKEFIVANASGKSCSFCGRRNLRKDIAAEGDAVIDFILRGIRSEYSTVDDECVPWDSEDGEYIVPTQSIYELIHYNSGNVSSRSGVLEWIVDCIGYDQVWCEKDPAILSPEQGLIAGWDDFCDAIKHKTRFLFFDQRPVRSQFELPEIGEEPYYVHPSEVLDELASTVLSAGLIRETRKGTTLFRARGHELGSKYSTVQQLGPPHSDHAKAGRMSAAGIPVFYGALETETAILEAAQGSPAVSIGIFELLRDIRILDLTSLPPVPSIFDLERIHLRVPLRFLSEFRNDITEPIELDGREHIEYTPSQVVSEFIKLRFRDAEGHRVEGVLYPSSRLDNGTNVVLFIESKNLEGVDAESYLAPERLLRLVEAKTMVLSNDPSTAKE